MERISRRTLLRDSAVLACAASFSARSSGQAMAQADAPTLVHWQHHHEDFLKATQTFADQFAQQDDGAEVKIESIPWGEYWDKLGTALASGRGPDTFMIPMGIIADYVRSGQVIPLDPTWTGVNPIDEFFPWTTERLKADEHVYGLPVEGETMLFFVNDEIAEASGVDLAEPPKTWDELESWAQAMTKKTDNSTEQIGADLAYYSALSELFMQQALQPTPMIDPETRTVTWDRPEALEAFSFLTKMVKEYDDPAFLRGQPRFVLGKAGMVATHPINRRAFERQNPDLKYTLIHPPAPAGKPYLNVGSHWAWVVNTSSQHYDSGWRWINFVTRPESQPIWFEIVGNVPLRTQFLNDPAFRETPNDIIVMDSMMAASPWCWVGWAEWVKLYGDAVERVVLAGDDPRESLDKAAAEANTLIQEYS